MMQFNATRVRFQLMLRVFTFSPLWGLPSAGPFALKLLAWLNLAGIDLDAGLNNEQRAVGLAWRRMFEEHFHQVLEWELLVHPAGASFMWQSLSSKMPPVIGRFLFSALRSHLRRQLHARGIARHPPDAIALKGYADADALAIFLRDRPFLLAEEPSTADTAVFGLLAPMVYWPMQTPVASHLKSIPTIVDYCERMRRRCFGNNHPAK
jgi:hypothetical protein